jgi:hypothetical protein
MVRSDHLLQPTARMMSSRVSWRIDRASADTALEGCMKYADGLDIAPGDLVQIAVVHRGTVMASMDTGRFLPGWENWSCLKEGIIVDTSFGGLVHYTSESTDELALILRPAL